MLLGVSALILAALFGIGLAFASLVTQLSVVQARSAAPVTTALRELAPGSCVLHHTRFFEVLSEYAVVDCSREHAAELVHSVDIGEAFARYPGTGASSDFVLDTCASVMEFRLHLRSDVIEKYPAARLAGVYSTRADWARGDRTIYCFLINNDGSPLRGGFYKAETFE